MGELATRGSGWTGPDMEAAQQLVHLSSDEEEYHCGNRGRREAKAAAAGSTTHSRGEEGKATSSSATREGKGAGELGQLHEGAGGDRDGKGGISCSRKPIRFRSIAYLYRVTRPVDRAHDEAKRRKIIRSPAH